MFFNTKTKRDSVKIIFLHHSIGNNIWEGRVADWFRQYNKNNGKNYKIIEQVFPKSSPYGWNNYPYDYWNIWVKNAGNKPFKTEPTLEILVRKYDVIIWKHCYPVSDIKEDTGRPDVNSTEKRIENYKLQYAALKDKMRQFPDKKFIVWTGAALVKNGTDPKSAERAKIFFNWVKEVWDEKGDNIYVWDFHSLETEGELYLKDNYAENPNNSHPNKSFSKKTAVLFSQRIVSVIEGKGDSSSITTE